MSPASRLALSFSPRRLRADLARCSKSFLPYANPLNQGEVLVAPLLSPGGNARALSHCPGARAFSPTPALLASPYLREVLDALPCPKLSARLILLPAGHGLAPHRDNWRGFRFGVLRLHVPILTSPGVRLRLAGRDYYWKAGELWYGDFAQEHSVVNESGEDRVHLVVDVQITPALLKLFPRVPPRREITFAAPEKAPRSEQLRNFNVEFDLPRGFLPSARKLSAPSVRARIEMGAAGALRLQAAGYGTLRLHPSKSGALVPSDIGLGNEFHFGGRGSRRWVEVRARGVLQRAPGSGQVVQADLRHRCRLRAYMP